MRNIQVLYISHKNSGLTGLLRIYKVNDRKVSSEIIRGGAFKEEWL